MPVPVDHAPIRTSLLRDTVHDRLRDAIVDGTLAPGEVVRDTELAAWLGVSRTPVREALLRLGESGLVRAAPGRSTVVAEIDLDEVREAHAVVVAMHRLAVSEAVARLTDDDLDRMRAANERFSDALASRDTAAALSADDDFHAVAVEAAGNRAVATVLAQFTPVVRRLERRRFASHAAVESVALHARLVAACAARDADAAAEVAFRTWQNLADLIPDAQPDQQETP
ncbi:GntR family transcriptional regulator [Nocardioides ganghwensis]|jgi:DNA-binding GntR family transcriptional regulator|uniref:GntR family transcriptional regulator n=1 Tax=Nocardioides ganghwensis TaxID=252230 RepID=A0A4V1RM14_9ACTN|nr:GntR family transcriptional regulator [Nocardioides ganghwensis]MBD3947774.1 GntR family transcriptional regulator [Nocardioides ganghwensis]RYB98102.1 GntR family transcriptional regulator [Nocardioides ganghwensis]